MKKNIRVILVGPQGSGKGTQGELLSEYLGVPMIVTGDVYRAHIRLGTYIGGMARAIIDRGELMPDDITKELMRDELEKIDLEGGVVIDGYPRNTQQAQDLDEMLSIDYLISLTIPNEVTIHRISNRRSCPSGHVWNLLSKPPRTPDRCDYDNEELYIRTDDKPEAIRRRLEIFYEETEPIVKYYKAQGKLLEVDGTGSIEEVHQAIIATLEKATSDME